MTPMQYSGEQPWSERYCWEIWLRRPDLDDPALDTSTMTAAEQMFFLGSPLAHVIEYEKHLRARRTDGPRLTASRLTRMTRRSSLGSIALDGPAAA